MTPLTLKAALVATFISALVVFLTRAFPFIVFSYRDPPRVISFIEKYIPPMIMAVLVVYCFKDVEFASRPWGLPSVIALGVILAWSGQFGINLYNTVWIILVAYIARYMAFSLKANSAALEQVHDSLVEASRACGATMWQSLRDVVLPLVRPGMFAAFFLIFLPSLRELTVSIMLYAPTTRTIGVAIYTLNEDGETVMSAALAGIALIIIIVGQSIINHFTKKAGM